MQKRKFSSDISIEYLYERKSLTQKNVLLGLSCSDKLVAVTLIPHHAVKSYDNCAY